jgi:predicted DsbA family dithiol-disulfide isomerase
MRLPINFFHDVLSPYCAVTSARLRELQQEFGDAVEVILRPYPLRPVEMRLSEKELRRLARQVREVSKSPAGQGFQPSIWLGGDPPLSTLPPLLALEAALLQGSGAQHRLLETLRGAAFRAGMNIARRDVIFECASSVGLDMPRFVAAFESPATARSVELSHRDAVAHGVRALPAVVIGDEWLMTGMRDLDEYRETLGSWVERFTLQPPRVVH